MKEYMYGRKLTPKQVGEFKAKEFLGEETWVKWKQDMDRLLSERNNFKVKPTEEQKFWLKANKVWIDFYNSVLYSGMNKG